MTPVISSVALLLLIAAVVSMVARRLKLPYTVGLVVSGLLLAIIPNAPKIELTRELIFLALLPPLIFEAAFMMNWRRLKQVMGLAIVLATLGVFIAAGIVTVGVHYILGWSWSVSAILAILISATDPVAVIAMFKDLKFSGRLSTLIEAESLFNDGTAAALFSVVLVAIGGGAVSAVGVTGTFLLATLGGVVCGGLIGGLLLILTGRTDDHLVEVTLTSVAAYGSFLLAEQFHMSGVLATLTAGIVFSNVSKFGEMSPLGRSAVEHFWEYLAFVANSLIFLLMGVSLTQLPLGSTWLASLTVIGLMLVGRAVSVYGCCGIFAMLKRPLDLARQHVLFWGGLRGAIALALVLGLPADFPNRQAILSVTFAVVTFSVIVQGLSIGPLIKALHVTEE